MEKNSTLKVVEKVDLKAFHHESRLLLDRIDASLIKVREISEVIRRAGAWS